jgi:hypothetical protein
VKTDVNVVPTESSVADSSSLNPDPDLAFQVYPDPVPGVFMTKNRKEIQPKQKIYVFL